MKLVVLCLAAFQLVFLPSSYALIPGRRSVVQPQPSVSVSHSADTTTNPSDTAPVVNQKAAPKDNDARQMIGFMLPLLGIFLSQPLLSNLDNAIVGRTVGTAGLAALSPGSMCTDHVLFLFTFISRATTGIVSRVYGRNDQNRMSSLEGKTTAIREAASTPLTVALCCGACLSIWYAFGTPMWLRSLRVDPSLLPAATSYVRWKGAFSWASLAQGVCMAILLATRDAVTPFKIVLLAALVNLGGDALFCVWPLRMGCGGVAAASSLATLTRFTLLLRALAQKEILPTVRRVSKQELGEIGQFMGPLLVVSLTRIAGFAAMQRAAMRLGVEDLAGFQLCTNLLFFFLLFGEPFSQLSQTKLPALLEDQDGTAVLQTLRSVIKLAGSVAIFVGVVAYVTAIFGSSLFTSDVAVHAVAKAAAPALFANIAAGMFTASLDGATLASRDFGFMLVGGIAGLLLQVALLPHCNSVGQVLTTSSLRMGSYAAGTIARAVLGFGGIGRVLRSSRTKPSAFLENERSSMGNK